MGHALYRKYRSKTLDEVVGQDHITTTLKNALQTKTLSHAYLFTGPKGVGKTSIARILAHEVNNLPYDETTTHLDIIEIDAASNRRIDEIRDLRDKVHISPTSAKYKVYIIDEVHMLTKEAFNALLKTLEEPPAHVIFILATTEFSKLPETIVSRTQHFTFRPIANDDATNHLLAIAKQEGINLSREAAEIIAESGRGSFRDSISLLDKLKTTDNEISADVARTGLGIAPASAIKHLMNQVHGGSPAILIAELEALYRQGYHSSSICQQLAKKAKSEYINSTQQATLTLYKQLVEISKAIDTDTLLEITLLEAQAHNLVTVSTVSMEPLHSKEPVTVKTPPKPQSKQEARETVPTPTVVEQVIPEPVAPILKVNKSSNEVDATPPDSSVWQQALTEIKKHHNTVYSVMRMAEPVLENNTMTLRFTFPFHYKQINDSKKLQLIGDVLSEIRSKKTTVKCELVDKKSKTISPDSSAKKPSNESILTINNIFGTSEVLES